MTPPSPLSSSGLSCSLQLLLASLMKLGRNPQLWQVSQQERLALAASCWPQLWAVQLAQSGADPRALLTAAPTTVAELTVKVAAALLSPQLARLVTAVQELRALTPDQAEWTMMENLVVAGRGKSSAWLLETTTKSNFDPHFRQI